MQSVIDLAAKEGGGVLVVPAGIYHTGALHFKQGVNLYVAQGGTLMGSDNIADYDLCETRMEGQNCIYFSALINADGVVALPPAAPAQSTATVCALGGRSGCAASGTPNARTRMSSVRGWRSSPTARM